MLHLSGLFSDHAVLQRRVPVPVWGEAEPFTLVECELNGVRAANVAGETGEFLLRLPPMEAGGPYEMHLRAGKSAVTLHDIHVGEVWIGSGQSNMEWTFELLNNADPTERAECAECPGIRMLTVEHVARTAPRRAIRAVWQAPSAETVGNWSALATFFAARLHRDLGVTVGIINSSWGGSIAEAWLSDAALRRNADLAPLLDAYEAKINAPSHWQDRADLSAMRTFAEIEAETARIHAVPDPGNTGFPAGWADPSHDAASWRSCELPGIWQNVLEQENNGVVWFRKELDLPASWLHRPLRLALGAADKQDITYVNGREIGRTGKDAEMQHWNVPRVYDVPAEWNDSPRITIAVRVRSFACDGGLIGPKEAMQLATADGDQPPIPLAGRWRAQVEHDTGKLPMTQLVMGDGNPNSFHILFDNMIAPLIPYAMRGVIWYQGESNEAAAAQYRELMCSIIRDWRYRWGLGDFPFLQVLLAGYRQESDYGARDKWPQLRKAQLEAATATGNHFAAAVDLGEADNIHPRYKKQLAERLALAAETQAYRLPSGKRCALPLDCRRAEDALLITFDTPGLATSDGQPPRTLRLAGADGRYRAATGEILPGGVLRVRADGVPSPVSVRYAWADNPAQANLTAADGLPLPPFER